MEKNPDTMRPWHTCSEHILPSLALLYQGSTLIVFFQNQYVFFGGKG